MSPWVQLIGDTDRYLVMTGQAFPHDVHPRLWLYTRIEASKRMYKKAA